MAVEPLYLLYGAIFVGALLLVEGLYYLYADTHLKHRKINRRMDLLQSGKEGREVFAILRPDALQDNSGGRLWGLSRRFSRLVASAGLSAKPKHVLLSMLGLVCGVFALIILLGELVILPATLAKPELAAGAAAVIGLGLPLVRLSAMARARMKKFGDQLPDALDIMVRSLKAGHPIAAALSLVAREMPDPIGTEFGIVVDEMTYGFDMRESLENLGKRVSVQDFQYVVMAINIQHETGGNLSEVLTNLSHVIRERHRMFMKIKALSGEGRVSATLLCVLPFAVGGLVFASAPSFYLDVADDPLFASIMAGVFVQMLVGVYMIRRMVNFRV